MRSITVAFLLLVWSYSITAQTPPVWQRVYTFDDSIIELNTQLVTLFRNDLARARFRWTFNELATLPGDQKLQYKSQLEVLEFNCTAQLYRPYHTTYYDAAGNVVLMNSEPRQWQQITKGSMTEKLLAPACELVRSKLDSEKNERAELDQVEQYAHNVAQRLEQTKDFKVVVDEFFTIGYLDGYLRENNTKWFLNLDQTVAETLDRSELQRYYIAMMNTGYLSSLYVISQLHQRDLTENLIPADVRQLIGEHHYTSTYKNGNGKFSVLAENIDTAERLRSYTDLLERVADLMRKHVNSVAAEQSATYKEVSKEWELYRAKVRGCSQSCFGLPAGTRLFEVNIPVFRLQLTQIGNDLKIVSTISRF